jgi:hypothetical protein
MTNKPCRRGEPRGSPSRCAWALATGSPRPSPRGAGPAAPVAAPQVGTDLSRSTAGGVALAAAPTADRLLLAARTVVSSSVSVVAALAAAAAARRRWQPRRLSLKLGRHSNDVGAVPTEARRRRNKTRACPHHVARPRTRRRRWRANHLRDLGSGETTRRI